MLIERKCQKWEFPSWRNLKISREKAGVYGRSVRTVRDGPESGSRAVRRSPKGILKKIEKDTKTYCGPPKAKKVRISDLLSFKESVSR